MKLSIVIPFFNELRRLEKSVATLFQFLKTQKEIEIIYVDDGSTDGTMEKLKETIGKKENETALNNITFQFIRLAQNQGKGAAIKKGMEKTCGDFSLFTDFDFAISLSEVDRFMARIQELPGQRGIIVASRQEDSVVIKQQSLLRKVLGRAFHSLMKLIVKVPVRDTQCGFKLFDTTTAKSVFPFVQTKGFAFDVEVLTRALKLGIPIIEQGVVITHEDEYSTINIFIDPFKMIFDLFKLRWRLFKENKG